MQLVLQNWSLKPSSPEYDRAIAALKQTLSDRKGARLLRVGHGSAIVEIDARTANAGVQARASLAKSLAPAGWKIYDTSTYEIPVTTL